MLYIVIMDRVCSAYGRDKMPTKCQLEILTEKDRLKDWAY